MEYFVLNADLVLGDVQQEFGVIGDIIKVSKVFVQ